jgi:uncharacterized oxidoreductase
MKTTGNTVLITGGSAGIGFETARLFADNGNKVIITGRNAERLQKAAAQLKQVTAIQSDVSDKQDVEKLVQRLSREFPRLNIVINNAGKASLYNLSTDTDGFEKAQDEMLTNFLSVIRLNEKLLPLLKKQEDAAIVNVSSIVAFAPLHILSTYGSSKAALHSYTKSLRFSLAQTTNIKVFDLMPPLVNTDFSQAIGGSTGILPAAVAERLMTAIDEDEYEIHVGGTADFYKLFLSSPADAFVAINTAR